MSYTELLPELIQKKLVQTRPPPVVPSPLPQYYKVDQTSAFHQGAPGNNVENYYPLKTEVQKLVKSGILSFKDVGPNVKDNPLTKHEEANVVMQQRRVNTPRRNYQRHQQFVSVTPIVGAAPTTVAYQRSSQQGNQGYIHRMESYDLIPMSYTELLPTSIHKKLVQT